ncbi:hypothetical protein AB0C11_09210 [Streptomyces sp. NPDC039016]
MRQKGSAAPGREPLRPPRLGQRSARGLGAAAHLPQQCHRAA